MVRFCLCLSNVWEGKGGIFAEQRVATTNLLDATAIWNGILLGLYFNRLPVPDTNFSPQNRNPSPVPVNPFIPRQTKEINIAQDANSLARSMSISRSFFLFKTFLQISLIKTLPTNYFLWLFILKVPLMQNYSPKWHSNKKI